MQKRPNKLFASISVEAANVDPLIGSVLATGLFLSVWMVYSTQKLGQKIDSVETKLDNSIKSIDAKFSDMNLKIAVAASVATAVVGTISSFNTYIEGGKNLDAIKEQRSHGKSALHLM